MRHLLTHRAILAVAWLVTMTPRLAAQVPTRPDTSKAPAAPARPAFGRIVGRIVERETGKPLQGAQVVVVGALRAAAVSDLDGRYDIGAAPLGMQAVLVRFIGFRAQRIDSVLVAAGKVATANAALSAVATQLAAVAITADPERTTNSDVGLLTLLKNSPSVADGISAQTISRTPATNAAEAITKVTGVAVQDGRYVIVRGMGERYNNTTLNGVELPSPEPSKRVVPLDIFPTSLLESIVTTKSATPDRPADFVGGAVDIRTKEFPDESVREISVSSEANSIATGQRYNFPTLRGSDYLGFDRTRKLPPGGLSTDANFFDERWAERVRNVWVPPSSNGVPSLGLTANVGGQLWRDRNPLGYVFSVTYGNQVIAIPDRYFAVYARDPVSSRQFLTDEASRVVDLGVLANLSWRIGARTKLGWKNTYTRNSEETSLLSIGTRTELASVPLTGFQLRYVARELFQSQLSGEHQLPWWAMRLEWKGTVSRADRDEPDNRNVWYANGSSGPQLSASVPSSLLARFLDDRMYAGQVDLTLPFRLRRSEDSKLKVGVMRRLKNRVFTSDPYSWFFPGASADITSLPPDQALSPENLGRSVVELRGSTFSVEPYITYDTVTAAYGMLDLAPARWLRVVAGARSEQWRLRMVTAPGTGATQIITRNNPDLLWSGNATVKFGERVNLRVAGFQGLTRPDPRELSSDRYQAVSAECATEGGPLVQRVKSNNGDVRLEVFPGLAELFAIGGFVKQFDAPLIERTGIGSGGDCTLQTGNAESAIAYGGEVEMRKGLSFLGLKRWNVSTNATYTVSRITFAENEGIVQEGTGFVGLSPWIVNAILSYGDGTTPLDASIQYNWFSDRLVWYGLQRGTATTAFNNYFERGRHTVDAKIRRRMGSRTTLTLSARNLTNAPLQQYVDLPDFGRIDTRLWRIGVSYKMGVTYAF
jgi:hypothetical protein